LIEQNLTKDLRVNLNALLGGSPSQPQLKAFAAVCSALAGAFLRTKLSFGKVNLPLIGLTLEDLAHDCIADLFQRDDAGSFIQVRTYFEGLSFQALPDEELLANLRRLVFSKVNQHLFRLYNDIDPALGRIYRNIKVAIHALGNFVEVDRFGETHIAPVFADALEHLPPFDPQRLEGLLRDSLRSDRRVPEMLSRLSLILRAQDDCSRLIPLSQAAYLFRSVFSGDLEAEHRDKETESSMAVSDASSVIRAACERTKERYMPKYVRKGKVAPETFGHYFAAIEANLIETFLGLDGHDNSLYDHLKQELPAVGKEEYRRVHKNILEYLCRQARRTAVEELKRG
jgi:hypothetical protein